ncbi:protein kinase domain protein [Ichthyophthirius multifiliis]|uniref:Aurora kinase n=1 Tax=Ichthyophthirius multifiliis TaxID=5932 RepID=G0R4J4_ICHMU|nr:protein kinase domain protein [Ichthyophthirius multifiliis]EGR27611.1 protein kinase domain protein [Ichthyophthirius multifiliis]|eukprot:XP_004025063.1 protein kinase domain protein [Ichthyophthirius multifiliis]
MAKQTKYLLINYNIYFFFQRDIQSGFIFAIKKIRKQTLINLKIQDYLQNEIIIQSFLNHANIIKLYGFYYDEKFIYLVQEYASHGQLYKDLQLQKGQKYDETQAALYIKQIISACIFLHQNNIIHRDLKPQNILLSYGAIKITDFGCSVYCPELKRQTFCGTLDYISPEMLNGEDYGRSVDIWSLGILAYELLTGKAPFLCEKNNEQLQKIMKVNIIIFYVFFFFFIINFYQNDLFFPGYVSLEAQDFINKLLQRDPNERINLVDINNNEWLNKNISRYSKEQWDNNIVEQTKRVIL